MNCSKCFYPAAKLTPIPDGRRLCDLCLNARIIQLDDRPTNDLRGSIMFVGNAILEELRKLVEPQHPTITYIKASDFCKLHGTRMEETNGHWTCPDCVKALHVHDVPRSGCF
jgi:hypothetical protein